MTSFGRRQSHRLPTLSFGSVVMQLKMLGWLAVSTLTGAGVDSAHSLARLSK
jgi:hypothetical protein